MPTNQTTDIEESTPLDTEVSPKVSPEIQRAKINLETARTSWESLQRFFANGSLIIVVPSLNLVDVAEATTKDDAQKIEQWMKAGLIAPPSNEQARAWFESKTDLWAVVVRPWVFAQELKPEE